MIERFGMISILIKSLYQNEEWARCFLAGSWQGSGNQRGQDQIHFLLFHAICHLNVAAPGDGRGP
jgi:hypothetical protein